MNQANQQSGKTGRSESTRVPLRAGFSFTEILFAVIILGIGFIMVAAIFPVAIQQGKLTNEQTVAASVGRGALSLTGQLAGNTDSPMSSNSGSMTNSNVFNAATFSNAYANTAGGPLLPATGTFQTVSGATSAQTTGNVWSFRDLGIGTFQQLNGTATFTLNSGTINSASKRVVDEMWSRVSQSLISPSDPRYAYVGLYRRDGDPRDHRTWSPFAQVWFIPVTTRSRTVYDTTSLPASNNDVGTANATMNLAARMVQVRIDLPSSPTPVYSPQPLQPYILYNYTSVGAPYRPSSVGTGCYVIIARDNTILTTTSNLYQGSSGRMNGHIYHVGARRPDLDTTAANDPDGLAAQAYDLQPDGDFVPDPGLDTIFNGGDDIYRIGNTTAGNPVTLNLPNGGTDASYLTASAPADAYVVGTDTTATDAGLPQDISAFSTFIKVN